MAEAYGIGELFSLSREILMSGVLLFSLEHYDNERQVCMQRTERWTSAFWSTRKQRTKSSMMTLGFGGEDSLIMS